VLKSSFLALFRSKKALLLVLLGVLSITTSVVLYRVYVHRDQVAVKPVDKKVDEQIKALLKKDREDLKFIENKGQWPSDVLFGLNSTTGQVWIRKEDVLFRAVVKKEEEEEAERAEAERPGIGGDKESYQAHTWKMSLAGMNSSYRVRTGDNQPTTYNYHQGSGKSTVGVSSFKEVTLEGVYPGIDLRFYSGDRGQIEYDFIVAPGADFHQVKIDYEGQDSLKVAEDKSLEIGLRFGTVTTHLPEAYQVKDGHKQIVEMSFAVDGNRATFEPASPVDSSLPLVIDPTLLWGTYFDNNTATFDAYAYASKANVCGEVYVAGWMNEALSGGVYTSTGFDNTFTATRQGIIYKFNATGTALLNLTFFGGALGAGDIEHANTFLDLDIFPDGRVIAVGRTQNTIVTTNGYQTAKGSATASNVTGMIAAFDSTLTTLIYSSYLGGSTLADDKETNAVRSVVVLDNTTYFVGGVMTGPSVVVGFANGPDTTTAGPEGYVARFSGANLNTRDWATFIGGDNTDDVFSIALTPDKSKVVFAGDTEVNTAGFPALVNAVDSTKNGTEVFVGYLNAAAAVPGAFGLLSYAGGTGPDAKPLVTADNASLYVAGSTQASDVPGAVNAHLGLGTLQVETATLAGGPSTGTSETVTVTAAGLTGSPLAIVVPMVAADTAVIGAGKIRTALSGNANITAKFTVGGAGATIVLTQLAPALANDGTLNIATTDGAGGFTNTATSANTTAGVAATYDIFVSKLALAGGSIVTRYLGGDLDDTAGGIVLIQQTGQVLIFGTSVDGTTDYPVQNTTPVSNFFDGTHNGGLDIVWTYLPNTLGAPTFSTFIGGARNDYLGDTGLMAGSGHIGYNEITGVITLATTTHSDTLPASIITAGVFDPTITNGSTTKDNHIILKFSAEVNDFGDAPFAYDNNTLADAAAHGATQSNPRFGARVDIDAGPQSGPLALQDDLISTTDPCSGSSGDDEDGLTVVPLSCSQVYPIVNYALAINGFNSSGSTANVYAWIDLNGNGVFENAEFQTSTLGSTGVLTPVNLVWPSLPAPPANTFATGSGLKGFYVRFRITTATLTDTDAGVIDTRARGQALDGEVEDYFIPSENVDYGDAPDTYGTSNVNNGARARIRTGLFIGAAGPVTDTECNGSTTGTGTQDDAAVSDDETGITSLSIGTGAASVNINIPVTNSTGSPALLCAWIDFNRNGTFESGGSPDEGVCSAPIPSSGSPQLVNLVWPLGAAPTAGASYMRLRLSTDPTLADTTPTGALTGINDGEVEDFPVTISALTAVDLASFKAYQLGDSVFLDWKTGFESDNLGFNVYRDLGGVRTQVTPSLLAGSALMVGSGVRLEAGLSYGWRDDAGKRAGKAQYWLEEVELNGTTRMHGPYSVESAEMMPITQRFQIAAQPRALRLNEMSDRLGELGGSRELEPSADLVFSDDKSAPARISNVASGTKIPAQARLMDLSGTSAVKIEVEKAGWYRVAQPDLVAAGLGRVDPRNLQLYAEGKQVPIRVTGEDDASFDTGDAIEFYGVGLDAPSTDARVYWLMASRLRGQRMPSSGAGGGGSPPPSFTHTVVRKDRLVYVSAILNGDEDNFFGVPIAGSNPVVNQVLSTPNAYTEGGGSATLEVAIQGVSLHDHVIRVSLNGQNLGTVSFSAQQRGVRSFNVAQTLLVAGDNQVKLERQSADSDVTVMDSLKLTYQHAWKADNNAVTASAASGQQVNIGGFTSPDLRIVDITDADSPVELNTEVTGQQGAFSVSAAVTGAGTRRLYAFASDQVRAATSVRANTPSTWKSQLNGANFVIISHSSLIPGIVPLAELRKSQGWNVAIVDVDDIYDEFAFGAKTPAAIADFLRLAATTWKVKPQAVLLVGKATYDPRSYLGQGDPDLVPTHMVETQTMESAVDDSLADFNGDGIPEMAVGRLPVRNLAEAVAMVRKIIGYEGSEPSNRVALISDISDTYSFDAVNDALKGTVPSGVDVQVISRGALGDATTRTKILEELDRSHRIVNYTGHGSIQLWRGDMLTVNDAASLQKSTELSLFVMMTCLNGYFISPLSESLSESLLRSGGGAVAAWASSGTTTPEGQQEMNVAAFQQLFGGQNLTIGEAARRAKAAVAEPDVRRTWNLLGDPTMRLK
jgi:hypothetical protein